MAYTIKKMRLKEAYYKKITNEGNKSTTEFNESIGSQLMKLINDRNVYFKKKWEVEPINQNRPNSSGFDIKLWLQCRKDVTDD